MFRARQIGPEVAREMVLLTALFKVTARRHGREQAYDFLKNIFQRVAVFSMPAIYQLDELVQCEGDAFENFKKFNVAMFEAMHRERTWETERIVNEDDLLRIKVVTCANVELFSALGCPELGRLGCDHQPAGLKSPRRHHLDPQSPGRPAADTVTDFLRRAWPGLRAANLRR